MGLAPYGQPRVMRGDARDRQADKTMAASSSISPISGITGSRSPINGTTARPSSAICFRRRSRNCSGPRRRPDDPLEDRHRDIARSAQAMYEEAFFHLIGTLQQRIRPDRPRARRRLRHELRRQRQGAAHDAVPAGLCAIRGRRCRRRYRRGLRGLARARRRPVLRHGSCLLGTAFRRNDIAQLACGAKRREIDEAGCAVEEIADEAELCRRTAAAIADGKVVGWFQGRMEWGPRALGNRSIVCDPRRADMKAILNAKIKRRESFRPFAPSVLEEARRRMVRGRRRRPLHDAGLPDPRGKAGANSRRHPCRRLRPAADRLPPHQPALLIA